MSLVLVAGGAGFLGSAIVRGLLRAGDGVVVLDTFDDAGDGRAFKEERVAALSGDARLEVVRGDATDPAVLERVFAEHRPSFVVNAMRLPPSGRGLGPLLEGARASGVGLLVHLSDGSLYGARDEAGRRAAEDELLEPGDDPYRRSQAAGEEALLASGLPFVTLRVFEAAGPGGGPGRFPNDALEAILADEDVILPDDAPRDFVHVEDVVRAVLFAISRRPFGEAVNVGFSLAVRPSDLVRAIAIRAAKEARIVISSDASRLPRIADLGKAWEKLGYAPTLDLSEIAWTIARARLFPAEAAHRAAASPQTRAHAAVERPKPVSRRELFGFLRKPFDDASRKSRS